jgi:hypothetical protein
MELKLHVRKNQNIASIGLELHRCGWQNLQSTVLHPNKVELSRFNRDLEAKNQHNSPICHFFRREKRTLFSLKSSFVVFFRVFLRI